MRPRVPQAPPTSPEPAPVEPPDLKPVVQGEPPVTLVTKPQGSLQDLQANIAKIRDLAQRQTKERRDELLARAEEYQRLLGGDPHSAASPEAPTTLETLAAELRRPDLTMEERQRIAMRLAELSYEQSTHALE